MNDARLHEEATKILTEDAAISIVFSDDKAAIEQIRANVQQAAKYIKAALKVAGDAGLQTGVRRKYKEVTFLENTLIDMALEYEVFKVKIR